MRTQNYLGPILLVLLLTPCASMAQIFYASEMLSATVTDWHGKPIAGAVVVVYWKLKKAQLHGHAYHVLHKAETITNEQGIFHVEAWGPKYGGLLWDMGDDSPYAYILKSGYKFELVSNFSSYGGFRCPSSKLAEVSRGIHTRSTIVASWSGCSIPLTQPTESPQDYAIRLSGIRGSLCDARPTNCGESLQRYFDDERRRLLALGVRPYW